MVPGTDKAKKKYPVVIPYMKDVSDQIRMMMKGYGIQVYLRLTNTLRQILVITKDKVVKERVVCPVYQIKCGACVAFSIGETEDPSKLGLWSREDQVSQLQKFPDISILTNLTTI